MTILECSEQCFLYLKTINSPFFDWRFSFYFRLSMNFLLSKRPDYGVPIEHDLWYLRPIERGIYDSESYLGRIILHTTRADSAYNAKLFWCLIFRAFATRFLSFIRIFDGLRWTKELFVRAFWDQSRSSRMKKHTETNLSIFDFLPLTSTQSVCH